MSKVQKRLDKWTCRGEKSGQRDEVVRCQKVGVFRKRERLMWLK